MNIPRYYGSASGSDRRCRSVGRLYYLTRLDSENGAFSGEWYDEMELYIAVWETERLRVLVTG